MEEALIDRLVFTGSSVSIGEFRCPPGHAAWRSENIAEHTIAVFPRVAVGIAQSGREPVIADPNTVMYYNAGQTYRRTLLADRGDACEFFAIAPAVIADAAEAFDPAVRDRPAEPFSFGRGPGTPRAYLRQRRLYARIASGNPVDPVAVEEEYLALLPDLIAAAYGARGDRPRRKAAPKRSHSDIAEAVKALLNRRLAEPLRLDDISDAVETSPFHLCRIFRAWAGMPIHRYLLRLRLAAALERLAGHPDPLTDLALDLGFSSHSHFTTTFTREFGVSPAAARAALRGPAGRERARSWKRFPPLAG